MPVPLIFSVPLTWIAFASSPLLATSFSVFSHAVIISVDFLFVFEIAIPAPPDIVALFRNRCAVSSLPTLTVIPAYAPVNI